MKFAKQSEIAAAYKSLRENGLDKETALKSLQKSYEKKGMEGDFVLNEDGSTCGLSDVDFVESTENGPSLKSGISEAQIKSITDGITKSLTDGFKSFVPAAAADKTEEGKEGFKSMGEFLSGLKGMAGGQVTPKLAKWIEKSGPSVAMGESTGQMGGVMVPPAYLAQMAQYDNLDGVDLLAQTDSLPMAGNSVTMPTNEETPWNGGVQAYWTSELQTISQVAPKSGSVTLVLNDLTCIVPMSNNLMDDAPAASTLALRKIAQTLRWKQNDAIINGGGAGMPLGVLNSPARYVVPKTTGQAAATISFANLVQMDARRLPGQEYAWFITPQGREQLGMMTLPGGLAPAAYNMLMGYSDKQFPSILSHPIVDMQELPALGQEGDIMLVNMRGYLSGTKQTQMATSIHMFFDTNATAFRAVARMDGKPWATKPVVSAKNPDFKMSQFIVLGARA